MVAVYACIRESRHLDRSNRPMGGGPMGQPRHQVGAIRQEAKNIRTKSDMLWS
jgi:hypothetical protein